MCLQMSQKSNGVSKGLFTLITLVRLVFTVSSLSMFGKLIVSGEGFPTLSALVRPFSSVDSYMVFQMARTLKRTWTYFAMIFPYSFSSLAFPSNLSLTVMIWLKLVIWYHFCGNHTAIIMRKRCIVNTAESLLLIPTIIC